MRLDPLKMEKWKSISLLKSLILIIKMIFRVDLSAEGLKLRDDMFNLANMAAGKEVLNNTNDKTLSSGKSILSLPLVKTRFTIKISENSSVKHFCDRISVAKNMGK